MQGSNGGNSLQVKTDLQHMIDLRDFVSRRYTETVAELLYWKAEAKRVKELQAKLTADNNVADRMSRSKKDKEYIAIIDGMIREEKEL